MGPPTRLERFGDRCFAERFLLPLVKDNSKSRSSQMQTDMPCVVLSASVAFADRAFFTVSPSRQHHLVVVNLCLLGITLCVYVFSECRGLVFNEEPGTRRIKKFQ